MAAIWKEATTEMIAQYRSHERLPFEVAGYVYLIQRKGTDEYKIGISNNWGRRLSELQKGNRNDLAIIHIIATNWPRDLEEDMHRHFRGQRLKGEWFNLTENDVHGICQIRDGNAGDCNLDLVMARYYGVDKP